MFETLLRKDLIFIHFNLDKINFLYINKRFQFEAQASTSYNSYKVDNTQYIKRKTLKGIKLVLDEMGCSIKGTQEVSNIIISSSLPENYCNEIYNTSDGLTKLEYYLKSSISKEKDIVSQELASSIGLKSKIVINFIKAYPYTKIDISTHFLKEQKLIWHNPSDSINGLGDYCQNSSRTFSKNSHKLFYIMQSTDNGVPSGLVKSSQTSLINKSIFYQLEANQSQEESEDIAELETCAFNFDYLIKPHKEHITYIVLASSSLTHEYYYAQRLSNICNCKVIAIADYDLCYNLLQALIHLNEEIKTKESITLLKELGNVYIPEQNNQSLYRIYQNVYERLKAIDPC